LPSPAAVGVSGAAGSDSSEILGEDGLADEWSGADERASDYRIVIVVELQRIDSPNISIGVITLEFPEVSWDHKLFRVEKVGDAGAEPGNVYASRVEDVHAQQVRQGGTQIWGVVSEVEKAELDIERINRYAVMPSKVLSQLDYKVLVAVRVSVG